MTNHAPEEFSLINIPPGKKYIGEDGYTTQAAQKGGVCWYYTFNLLRPRIGKKLERLIRTSLNSNEQVAEATELLAIRETEKIISKYRKNTERRYLTLAVLAESLENLDKSNIKIIYQSYLEFRQNKNRKMPHKLYLVIVNLNKLGLYPQNDALEQIVSLLEQFMSQNVCADLNQYAEIVRDEDVIKYSDECCKALGIEHELMQAITERTRSILLEIAPHLKDQIAMCPKNKLMGIFNNLRNNTRASTILDFITKEFAKKYNLTPLAWDPVQDGFSGLLKHINSHRALGLHVNNIGLAYYKTPPLKECELNNYGIYSWPIDAKKLETKTSGGHAITLVGAERIKNESGETRETVLFLDPNDKSKADKKRIVYRIPYEILAKNIMSSVPLYCVNKEFDQHVNKTYQNWKKKTKTVQTINKELERLKNFRSTEENLWVNIGVIEASDAKIIAIEELKAILRKCFLSGKASHEFHDELRKWKEASWECIVKQRNCIHSFFSPNHKPAAAIAVDEIFTTLGIIDRVEMTTPIL